MEKYWIEKDNIYQKLLNIFLQLLLITVPLFANKYVYNFRVNQEAILKLFTVILFAVWLVRIINIEKYSMRKTKLDLPIFLFVSILVLSLFISETKTLSLQDFIIFFSLYLQKDLPLLCHYYHFYFFFLLLFLYPFSSP